MTGITGAMNMMVACVQLNGGANTSDNLTVAAKLIHEAAQAGAELVVTPENTDFMRMNERLTLETALPEDGNSSVKFFSVLAKELGIWLLIGSMKIKLSDTKVANRSFLFNSKGHLMASYDKIHLFDVDLPNGESHRESETVEGGKKAVIANVEGRNLGFTICYDVRFPYLYRTLAQQGAEMIVVPAAFTTLTGKDHWETLLRARAIETGSYIIAPAQVGEHEGGRKTHGHSMIITPWGRVVAEASGSDIGIITHKVDFLNVAKARGSIPSLKHDREYEFLKAKF